MCNSRAGGVDDDLADGLGTEGTGRFIAVLKLYLQAAHVQTGGHLVLFGSRVFYMKCFGSFPGFTFLFCCANIYMLAFAINPYKENR